MNNKICAQCNTQVDETSKFCPRCGSSEFVEEKAEVMVSTSKPSLIHSLFYWNYDGHYVLSKSKLIGIVTFFVILSTGIGKSYFGAMVLVSFILAMIIFLFGCIIHHFNKKPSDQKLIHNDYGIIRDIIDLLFYWQNEKTGEYVLSKTKIITIVLFFVYAIVAVAFNAPNLFGVILLGMIVALPAFLIGYAIHRHTNPYPTNSEKKISKPKEIAKPKPVIEAPKDEVIPEYAEYKNQVTELIDEYNKKEAHARDLIEKRFEPPQMTYNKFIGVIGNSTKLFNNQADAAITMITLGSDYSPKMENEIKSKISNMKTIISKMDDLTNELVLASNKDSQDEVDNLFEEMSELMDSIKDY